MQAAALMAAGWAAAGRSRCCGEASLGGEGTQGAGAAGCPGEAWPLFGVHCSLGLQWAPEPGWQDQGTVFRTPEKP